MSTKMAEKLQQKAKDCEDARIDRNEIEKKFRELETKYKKLETDFLKSTKSDSDAKTKFESQMKVKEDEIAELEKGALRLNGIIDDLTLKLKSLEQKSAEMTTEIEDKDKEIAFFQS